MSTIEWKRPNRKSRDREEELRDFEHRRVSRGHSDRADTIIDTVNQLIDILNNLDLEGVQIPNPIAKIYPQID